MLLRLKTSPAVELLKTIRTPRYITPMNIPEIILYFQFNFINLFSLPIFFNSNARLF